MDNSHHRNCCYHFYLIECHHYHYQRHQCLWSVLHPLVTTKQVLTDQKKSTICWCWCVHHKILFYSHSIIQHQYFAFIHLSSNWIVYNQFMQFCNATLLSDDTITKFTIMLYFDLTNMILAVATIHAINTTHDLLSDPK